MEIEPKPKQAFCPPCCMVRTFFFSAQEQQTCRIADCTGWLPASTAAPLEIHTFHKAKAQGPLCTCKSWYGGLGLPHYKDVTHILFASVACLNRSRQLSCHLELVHFCPFTNPSHLCPGTIVMCNNCIADLKNNSLGLFMNACYGY